MADLYAKSSDPLLFEVTADADHNRAFRVQSINHITHALVGAVPRIEQDHVARFDIVRQDLLVAIGRSQIGSLVSGKIQTPLG